MEPIKSKKKRNLKKQLPEDNIPKLLLSELANANRLGEKNFTDEVKKAALKTDCKYLFDVPRILMDQKNGTVAAIVTLKEAEPKLYFITTSGSQKSTFVVEQKQAPKQLVNFAWSFANVLSLVGAINPTLTSQKLTTS